MQFFRNVRNSLRNLCRICMQNFLTGNPSCSGPQARSGSFIKSSVEYRSAPDVLAKQSSSPLSISSGLSVSPVFLSLETSGELAQTCSWTSWTVVVLYCPGYSSCSISPVALSIGPAIENIEHHLLHPPPWLDWLELLQSVGRPDLPVWVWLVQFQRPQEMKPLMILMSLMIHIPV